MNRQRHILFIFAAILLTGVSIASTRYDNRLRKKARYFYLEGVEKQVYGDNAGAYELYKKAYTIDSTYAEAASAYGSQRMTIQTDSFQNRSQMLASLMLMRDFVDEYPGDFFESQYYAYLASRLDTLPEALRIFEREDSLFPSKTATLVHLAETRMASDDLKGAIAALDKLEKAEGMSPQITLRKITYYITKQDTANALRAADELIASNVREATYKILKGNVFDALNMPDSAFVYYELAEKTSPESGIAKIALANYYKERGDSAAYDNKIYEALLTEDFDLGQKSSLLAEYLQKLINDRSSTARGDHLFKVLRDQYPHEPMVLDLAARYSAAKGDVADAIEEISYALDLSPDRENYWGQLMSYQMTNDNYQGAMNTYRRAARHISPSESLKLMYASAAAQDHKLAEAMTMYGELLRAIDPSLAVGDTAVSKSLRSRLGYDDLVRASTIYNLVGDAYYQEKELDKSFKAYENAIFFFADNDMALNNYAYFLVENDRDLDRALELSRHSLELNPENPTFLDTYAWILFKKGEYEKAKEKQLAAIERSEETKDVSSELYSHMGDILFMCGDQSGAVEYWKKALRLEPDNKLLSKKIKNKTYYKE